MQLHLILFCGHAYKYRNIYKYVLMIFSMAVTRMPKTYICLPHIIRSTLTCINDIIGKAFLASTPLKTFYTSIHFWVKQLIYQFLIYYN